ncbi:MAG: phosphoribosylformylglycinamidine synthase subunit PurQ [Geminicoccaceae bacterium]|nr:MAG: phosphoribosylformylglycinamidine synthase subunit PurQ [Geminicoccaceae bacterium]
MRVAVVTFPGSNCDRDLAVAFARATGRIPKRVWHADSELPSVDVVGLPGGFSYGDYLRCGAIAARSPIMRAVADFAARGGRVLGICNGFQILTEAGLLPGALIGNRDRRFVSRWVELDVTHPDSDFTRAGKAGQRLRVPIAHHDGNYTADAETLARLEGDGRVAFRYVDNPNGSAHDIAGILSAGGNVLGLMPHPERAIDKALGGTDGSVVFRSLVEALA